MSEDARARAQQAGADDAHDPETAVRLIRSAGGADVAIEAAGTSGAARAAVRSLGRGGRAVVIGAGSGHLEAGSLARFVFEECDVVGSYGSTPDELREVLDLIATGRLKLPGLIGDEIGLEELPKALHRLRDTGASSARIVVRLDRP